MHKLFSHLSSYWKMYFITLVRVRQNVILDKGEGGVSKFLIISDKKGRGGLDPLFSADIKCEQPLIVNEIMGLSLAL